MYVNVHLHQYANKKGVLPKENEEDTENIVDTFKKEVGLHSKRDFSASQEPISSRELQRSGCHSSRRQKK